ncbi:hypothetical protein IEN85_01835 [Pelagicoccus sp. NFK12]|uniref:Uncharacterized protein n=1 Tax=Pelagicoccus enzymogenes TaxID=2773457 RepID=A0A927F776_9BACT|nr:hypothetical protein [Pelagicoccus enzymogenes]MBD5778233.1 hypothetical protein [Pelagicoccus enzymogenes]MDQ8200898.1 hypothetical protein [Pelagicoccus enzymogenes]
MKYIEFRDSIHQELIRSQSGKTWKEIKDTLDLPYDRPCPEWIARMELDIGLERKERRGNALVWSLAHL